MGDDTLWAKLQRAWVDVRAPGCGSQKHQAWSGSFVEPTVENRENSGGCFDVGIQLH